eukprot:CAMPEP_0174727726 /NCGR_PEP_ID=MMETSP1094-20130205/50358_1 /TAXON_ID=156173 /ORGANISM="Chrysochromulina brevifilum, Strain UTEX LB 985" /LENGTH=152 /DNA_ID=CAMNT_0015929533 /DNA_START=92 /DNA_END=546 /DNA_ORIENTATION=-
MRSALYKDNTILTRGYTPAAGALLTPPSSTPSSAATAATAASGNGVLWHAGRRLAGSQELKGGYTTTSCCSRCGALRRVFIYTGCGASERLPTLRALLCACRADDSGHAAAAAHLREDHQRLDKCTCSAQQALKLTRGQLQVGCVAAIATTR